MHFFDPITDFIFIENEPEPADVIFTPAAPAERSPFMPPNFSIRVTPLF